MLRPCRHCDLTYPREKRVATHEATCPVTLLYDTASANDPNTVARLIDEGVNCDALFERENGRLENALTVATKRGHFDVVELLIKAGVFLDVRTGDLCTPREMLLANSKMTNLINRCTPVARLTYAKII
jgi:ankyrin repeat protein